MKLRSGGLTEREKKYLEYWLGCKWKRKGLLVVISSVALLLFLGMGFIYGETVVANVGAILSVVFLVGVSSEVYASKEVYVMFMMGPCEIYRTKIEKKIKVYNRSDFKGYYWNRNRYYCEGIPELVPPLSAKLYRVAKVGDEVTVVKIGRLKVSVAINFCEKYDKYIL